MTRIRPISNRICYIHERSKG